MLSTERLFSFRYNGTPFWELPYTVSTEKTGNVTHTRYTLADGTGLLTVFRREHSPYETARFPLSYLEEDATYRVRDTDGTFDRYLTGRELTDGILLTQEKRSAKLYLYQRVKA